MPETNMGETELSKSKAPGRGMLPALYSAADLQNCACYERRLFGSQVNHRIANVLGQRDPAKRGHLRYHGRPIGVADVLVDLRVGGPDPDRIHTNALAAYLLGQADR